MYRMSRITPLRGNGFVFSNTCLHYASSSFLILRSGGSVLRSLLPPLLDDGGSVLTVGLEGEVEGGEGGGKSDGWVVVGRRLRFFFVFFFGAVVALLLGGDDREAAAPPADDP